MNRWTRWSRRAGFGLLGILVLYGIARISIGAVASSRLEAELARIRAAGEPLTLAEALPPIPEAENVAPLLVAASAQATGEGESGAVPAFLMDPKGAPEPALVAASAWVEHNKTALELLVQALAARPRCRFGAARRAADLQFDEIPGVMKLSRLLATRANAASRRGNVGAALVDAQALDLLGERVAQSPLLVHRLVGAGVQGVGVSAIELALQLGRPPEETCRTLERSLGSLAPFRIDRSLILTERVYGSELFDRAGDDRRARDAMAGFGTAGSSWLCALFPGPALSLDHVRSLRSWSGAIPLSGRPWSEAGPAWADLEGDARRDVPWYARYSNGGIEAASFSCLRLASNEARRHMARLALRIELHEQATGSLPERLEDLKDPLASVDPVSGLPYGYRRTDEGRGYLLYALGANRKDDGGAGEDDTTGPRGDDLAFRRPAR